MSSQAAPGRDAAAAAGNKKRRRKRVTTVVDDADCPTCSSCQSRLASVTDVTRLQTLDFIKCSGTLSCAACGSMLTPLRDLVR
ncbi:Zn-finger protein [Bovine papular stomatitis virus]